MTDTNDKFADSSLPLPSSDTDFNAPIKIGDIYGFSTYFTWGQQSVGFGELSISIKNGVVNADTEGMGKEWCRRALYALVDKVLEQTHDETGRPR